MRFVWADHPERLPNRVVKKDFLLRVPMVWLQLRWSRQKNPQCISADTPPVFCRLRLVSLKTLETLTTEPFFTTLLRAKAFFGGRSRRRVYHDLVTVKIRALAPETFGEGCVFKEQGPPQIGEKRRLVTTFRSRFPSLPFLRERANLLKTDLFTSFYRPVRT
ncbi:MAG: hypothetical protein RL326_315 [Pseudomonadota bacterium]|jgi:hypothetical protein